MTTEQHADYKDAIGRKEWREDIIDLDAALALAATLDAERVPANGEPLPAGWHWLYFNPFVRRSLIGHDGHPKRGGFLPDVKLPRRMWAGSRIAYHAPLVIGANVQKESEITNVVSKSGVAGELVFVTVRHRYRQEGAVAVEEEQDIVYREAATPGAPPPRTKAAPTDAEFSSEFTPDPVLLFRYSALTSNGHRIHYDRAYAQDEECYRDLVVHGPLSATLLQGFASLVKPAGRITGFEFRGMAPVFADRPFHIEAGPGEASKLPLWIKGPDGELAMSATATFAGGA